MELLYIMVTDLSGVQHDVKPNRSFFGGVLVIKRKKERNYILFSLLLFFLQFRNVHLDTRKFIEVNVTNNRLNNLNLIKCYYYLQVYKFWPLIEPISL